MPQKKYCIQFFIILSAFVIANNEGTMQNLSLQRQERGIIPFPLTFTKSPSIYQFICGIGIPVQDLDTEIITTGMVFKSTYHLPAHIHDFTKHNINGRKSKSYAYLKSYNTSMASDIPPQEAQKTENRLSKYRWMFYKALELISKSHGYAGRSCVLKAICEAAEVPFHNAGIFNEVAHILLRPSTSNDKISTVKDQEYIYAEYLGQSGADCSERFKICQKSILEQFSYILNLY